MFENIEKASVLPLVIDNYKDDSNLRIKCQNVPFPLTDIHQQLVVDMIQTMRSFNALGIAANQVGHDCNVIIIENYKETPLVLINPVVTSKSDETFLHTEGCLSLPNLLVKIKRSRQIRVRYREVDGAVASNTFKDLTAAAIQHEVDHLNGIVMTDKVSKLRREMSKKAASKVFRRQQIHT